MGRVMIFSASTSGDGKELRGQHFVAEALHDRLRYGRRAAFQIGTAYLARRLNLQPATIS
ncbi:hypothetical protein SBDP1_360007 [Syntrophobacter sp. SbD1]|nr:hypothetical protein SBDP1_360007 [Syntrophobacter sp. SbD1]